MDKSPVTKMGVSTIGKKVARGLICSCTYISFTLVLMKIPKWGSALLSLQVSKLGKDLASITYGNFTGSQGHLVVFTYLPFDIQSFCCLASTGPLRCVPIRGTSVDGLGLQYWGNPAHFLSWWTDNVNPHLPSTPPTPFLELKGL